MSPPYKRRRLSRDPDLADHGSTYSLILEHVLSYPGTFELPYLTMTAVPPNATSERTPDNWLSKEDRKRQQLEDVPPVTTPLQSATADFITCLSRSIGHSPSQPCSLPPSFTSSFLRRCFPSELSLVDFPHALIGLEYLDDINTRRRRDVSNAKKRLGIDPKVGVNSLPMDGSPGLEAWLREVNNIERKAEALYTQLYVALRRWVSDTIEFNQQFAKRR